MKARLVVFPVKGRNWCFSRSIESNQATGSQSAPPKRTIKDLWKQIYANDKAVTQNAEMVIDFVADKMNHAWSGLEKAPDGSFKNKLHNLGLFLLSRVKPSEIFLKSITKEINKVEVTYPASLNPRLVRRRLRHIAIRGDIIHRRYFYGSVTLLPLTSALAVLPLPNVPFFWILFRTYSHWRALQGSERLLLLVTDSSERLDTRDGKGTSHEDEKLESHDSPCCPLILKPSKELEKLLGDRDNEKGLSKSTLSDICKAYHLDTNAVLKNQNSV